MATAIFTFFGGDSSHDDSGDEEDMKLSEAAGIIRRNWAALMLDQETVGAKIYDLILTKEVTMSRLFISSNIEQQSSIFMTMMDKVVGFLDDDASMDRKLQELGALHVRNYNVKTRHFKHFRAAFLRAIKVYLPWSDKREAAWQLLWRRIITEMTRSTQANHLGGLSGDYAQQGVIAMARTVIVTFDAAHSANPKAFAVGFYRQLIEEQPEIGKLFSSVRKSDESMESQAARFVAMLAHAIKLLDDTETFTTKLESLSAQHVAYGVKQEMLGRFGQSLIAQVKRFNLQRYEQQQQQKKEQLRKPQTAEQQGLSRVEEVEKWGQHEDESWAWFWRLVVDTMTKGMDAHITGSNGGGANHSRLKPTEAADIQEEEF